METSQTKSASPKYSPTQKEKTKIKDCLVIFIGVDKEDETDPTFIAEAAVREIQDIAKQVKNKNIVLYPWVHLTSDPADPLIACKILMKQEELLLKKGFVVSRAPFGWYKSFNISVKGHPLAELSREIKVGKKKEEVSKAVKAEEKLVSHWHVLDKKGLHKIKAKGADVTGYDFKGHENLEKFAHYEIAKERVAKEQPPHIKLMREHEIADYEPGSDPGNLRFYPKGRLIKALLEEWVTNNMQEYGAMEVETPIMYDLNHPTIKSYLNRFPARQYTIQTPNKQVFLRFAACFGQFLMAHDAVFSYKQLPLRIYELTRYSFRVEKRGELSGLRRLRAFTMPDCHALCKDLHQAKKEMLVRFELAKNVLDKGGVQTKSLEMAIRFTKEFYEKNKDFIAMLLKKWGKPVLVEVWDKQFFYFTLKYDWNFVDALDKASALTTDQIDVENGKKYGITFVDSDGKKKHPLILHLSPSGSIERVIYALLEQAAMGEGKFPLWLAPTQVRMCPVSADYLELAEKLANEIPFRVDIDDRDMTVGKKVSHAAREWVPYVLVVGEKEESGKSVTVRYKDGSTKTMPLKQMTEEISRLTNGMPFRPLPLPKLLSKRPTFLG